MLATKAVTVTAPLAVVVTGSEKSAPGLRVQEDTGPRINRGETTGRQFR